MAAALFYHITRSPVETVVAALLARALRQGWRVELRGTDPARLADLDERLWLGPPEGFLPHGLAGGPHDARQPVLLTTGPGPAANAPDAVMALDGAAVTPADVAGHQRVWILFDGTDPAAVDHARGQWRALTAAGTPAEYWSEESGPWEKKAEKLPSGPAPARPDSNSNPRPDPDSNLDPDPRPGQGA